MKPKSLLLLLPFLLLSCGGKKNSDQPSEATAQITEPEFSIVPFETGIETEREILLSEIADSIRYIPLETNNKCLIRGLKGTNIIQTKEYFFLPWLDKLFQYTKMVNSYGHWAAKAVDRVNLTGSCRLTWMKKKDWSTC